MNIFIKALTFAACIFYTEASFANQISFQRQEHNGRYHFAYKWADKQGEVFHTKFSLFSDSVKKGFKEYKRFDNKEMNQYLETNLLEYVRKTKPQGLEVNVKNSYKGLSFKMQGRVDQSRLNRYAAKLKKEMKYQQNEFIKARYMAELRENVLIPDHVRIAERYITAMNPVARVLSEEMRGRSKRDVTNHVLNFIQNIPYDTLQSRRTSNGSGFQTPYGIILGNRGDCDSKSVMFMAIMKNIYPYSKQAIVYVPGHAFVGFDFADRTGDYVIRVNGTKYVLAEPVGPRNSAVGELAPSSIRKMKARKYQYRELLY